MKEKLLFENQALLNEAAVDIITASAREAVDEKGFFTMALSGGSSPLSVYARLALPVNTVKFPWNRAFVFWSDERFVPPSGHLSNFYNSYAFLLSRVPLNPRNVFRVPVEARSPKRAAVLYERLLRKFFAASGGIDMAKGMPVFDLILLGAGPDGHVASLFPSKTKATETDRINRWVVNTRSPEGNKVKDRITFTFPVINSAKQVLVIAPGKNKKEVADKAVKESGNPEFPVTMVDAGRTIILASS